MELSHPEEYKALRRAAARQDGQIIDPPESLSHSPLCRMEGRRYVKWHKRQTARKWWEKIKGVLSFWIPTCISIAALIVSIIALRSTQQ